MDNRKISEEFARIGAELIRKEDDLAHLRSAELCIIYLTSDHEKRSGSKRILGQCEKIQDKYKWGIPADFTITVFEPNTEGFTETQKEALIFHELLHIGGEEGAWKIEPHDLEDFRAIIDKYGPRWSE